MTYDFDRIMSGKEDSALLEMLDAPEGNYIPEALEAAKNELKKRNLSAAQIKTLKNGILKKHEADDANSFSNLKDVPQLLEKFLPGINHEIDPKRFSSNEADQKTWQMARMVIRFFPYIVLIISVILTLLFARF